MKHKRGDTFQYVAVLRAPIADGDFAGWVPSCQVRDMQGKLIADIAAAWADPVTARSVSLSASQTYAWPVGIAVFDVRFTRASDGFSRSSSSIQFEIIDSCTAP